MEEESLLDVVMRSSTNTFLGEAQLMNIFGVSDLDQVPTDKLLEFCNRNYLSKGGPDNGRKV